MKKAQPAAAHRTPVDLDIDNLLHPARDFEHPRHVVNDPDLTLSEKRTILASWASDACAMEAAPALRQPPGSARPVSFDDVMDALRALDRQAMEPYRAPPHYRRVLAERTPGTFGRKSRRHDAGGQGPALN